MKNMTLPLDSMPYPAMIVSKDRIILVANQVAIAAGAQVGGLCWCDFGHAKFIPAEQQKSCDKLASNETQCTFCLADESLQSQSSQNVSGITAFGRIWDVHCISLDDGTFFHYAFDITAKQRSEEHLQYFDKMELVGQLVNGIVHEVKNPLGIILGHAQTIKRFLKDPDEDTVHSLGVIEEAVERASDVLNQLSDFSREAEIHFYPLQLDILLQESVDLLSFELLRKKINIEWDFVDNLPAIYGIRPLLQQMFVNLILNAIEALDDCSEPRITITFRDISGKQSPYSVHGVMINIEDNGRCILQGDFERIFNLFFSSKPKGSGMGLAICKKIVYQHGGTIHIENVEPEGVRVNIFLPVSSAKMDTEKAIS